MIKIVADMYLAAAYLAYGAELLKIDKSNTRHQMFEFSNSITEVYTLESSGTVVKHPNPTMDFIETAYISRKLLFPPSYTDSLRRIKVSIHSSE